MTEGNTTATLLPWQALECIFIDDNTSFINITKITTMPVDGEQEFNFNGTFQNGTENTHTLTLADNTSSKTTDLLEVPSGDTSLEELAKEQYKLESGKLCNPELH